MKIFKTVTLLLALAALITVPAGISLAADNSPGKITRAVATVGADGVQRLEITGGEYYYEPNYLVVKINTPMELKVKKAAGFIPHNLLAKSPEAGIDIKIDLKNDFQTIKFTPTKTGKFPMYCDKSLLWMANHREKGMEGMIEVVE